MSLTVAELNKRSIDIFRELVDAYVETGEPVGLSDSDHSSSKK